MLPGIDLVTVRELIGETFHVGTAPYAMTAPVVLENVDYRVDDGGGGETVSLRFAGPAEPFIAQGTYMVMHEALPPQLLFVVPIGRTPNGFRYEIIINTTRDTH